MPVGDSIVYGGGIFHQDPVFGFQKNTFRNIFTGSVYVNVIEVLRKSNNLKYLFHIAADSKPHKLYPKCTPRNFNKHLYPQSASFDKNS